MAAVPLALKIPESISTNSTNGSINKDRAPKLHRPYSLSDSEDEKAEKKSEVPPTSLLSVVSTLSTKDAMNLIYTNTFQKSPLAAFPYESSYNGAPDTLFRGTPSLSNGIGRSPPPLEKMRREKAAGEDSVFANSPDPRSPFARVFDYNWSNSVTDRKPLYENGSLPTSYDALLKANYEKMRFSVPFRDSPPISSAVGEINPPSRSPTKARMKYTPMRENIFSDSLATTSGGVAISPTMFLSRGSTEDRKPYRRQTDLVRSMNLHSAAASQYDLDHNPLKIIQSPSYQVKQRHLSESLPDKRSSVSSAFSVIRPHFQRMYERESGYNSDPSEKGKKLFKPYETFEKSKIYARRHSENYRPALNGNNGADIDKEIGVSRLHVSDEASKEALQAFDAHVQKMMAEKSRLQGPAPIGSPKLASMSRPKEPMAIQCSTIDSSMPQTSTTLTNVADLSHGVGGLLGLTRIANEHLGQAIAKEKKRSKNNNCLHLWQFLRTVLEEEKDKPNRCIEWTNRERGEFRLIKTAVIADLWGQSKNRKCMTYEKMARAMRYYYKMKILEKVPHKRLHFRFGEKMLARVLDPNTIKPFRRMSTGDQHMRPANGTNGYYSGPPPPLQMLRRGSIDGLNSPGVISSYQGGRLGSQSDCPPTPMTPLSPCTPMTPLTPCTPGVNRTPVIMSRSTNVFFPPDSPLPKLENYESKSPPRNGRQNSPPTTYLQQQRLPQQSQPIKDEFNRNLPIKEEYNRNQPITEEYDRNQPIKEEFNKNHPIKEEDDRLSESTATTTSKDGVASDNSINADEESDTELIVDMD